jgi:hypothetical protein
MERSAAFAGGALLTAIKRGEDDSTMWSRADGMRRQAGRRVYAVALSLALGSLGLAPIAAQDLPPPDVKVKKKPEGDKGRPAAKTGGETRAAEREGDVTLLLTSEIGCSVTIDGEHVGAVAPRGLKKVPVSMGQHYVVAKSDDGKRQWEQIVEAKGKGQIIVKIDFASSIATKDEFDRRVAGVATAMVDVGVAAEFAKNVLGKSFGFQNQDVSTTIFAAHQALKREMESFRTGQTTDPTRKQVAEDLNRASNIVDQYVDLVTKAIAAAQQANSWSGEPNKLYSQAAATLPGSEWSAETWRVLRGSQVFIGALPPDEQARRGLAKQPAGFNLGAQALYSDPTYVVLVAKDGLADQMGLKPGDKLRSVKSVWELKLQMLQYVGKKLNVEIERKGKSEIRELRVPSSFPPYPPVR